MMHKKKCLESKEVMKLTVKTDKKDKNHFNKVRKMLKDLLHISKLVYQQKRLKIIEEVMERENLQKMLLDQEEKRMMKKPERTSNQIVQTKNKITDQVVERSCPMRIWNMFKTAELDILRTILEIGQQS
ncbi:MAG: hypothetical protein COA94_08265 [Rickettsiales bacterium]|nr:MAG: hypothetical protein COA94_08265 [Rickettsiales bacterium]